MQKLTVEELKKLGDSEYLNISEMFYSIEGEGIRIGEPTFYIRVIGCPHRCSWCDTPYSIGQRIDRIEKYVMSLNDIVNKLESMVIQHNITGIVNVEFTGGSPDWRVDPMGILMSLIRNRFSKQGTFFVFQISGGIYGDIHAIEQNYFNSRDLLEMSDLNAFDYKDKDENIPFVIPIKLIRPQDEIKFLIKDDSSYEFVKDRINYLNREMVNCKYIITTVTNNNDLGITEDHLIKLKKWTEKILNDTTFNKNNVKIVPREHILLWGNKKGV